MKNIAILASHNASALDAIYKAVIAKKLNLNIRLLISNNTNAPALKKAKKYNIDHYLINSSTSADPCQSICDLLRKYECEYIFLAGYMKKISSQMTQNFEVLNSHPSLLPKYGGAGMYGKFVHEAVISNGETKSGVTIHKVNEEYDDGEIILQKELQLEDGENVETLEKKIKELEAKAIVEALQICLK